MRRFSDRTGAEWQVWRVQPSASVYRDRRRDARRKAAQDAPVAEDRRTGYDRRKGDIQQGWLCFDGPNERRRLYPVPPEWENCSDERLDLLLRLGEPVRRTSLKMDDSAGGE